MKRFRFMNMKLVFGFAALTLVLTWAVILGWDKFLRIPFYSWVEARYPRNMQWDIEQRTEHFFISTSVDVIVVTLLLRMVNRQQRGLRESEERYRSVFENASDGIGVVDGDHRFVEANTKLGEILACEPQKLIGRDICGMIQDGHYSSGHEAFLRLLEGGTSKELELMMQKDTGVSLPVSVSASTLLMANQKLLTLIIRDLSERKQAEEALNKLSRAVDQTADTICITDKNGLLEYVNPAFEQLTGYTKEEAYGQTFRILKSGQHPQKFYERLWQTILSGDVHRAIFINRKKNGDLYYEEKTITPLKDSQGNMTHFVSTGKDITESKRAEEALQESERRYRLLFENNPLPMWVFDSETLRFLDVNESAIAHYGYSRDEFLAMTITDIRPAEDVPLLITTLQKSYDQLGYAGRFRHLKRDGSIIAVDIISHKLNFDGRPAECVMPNDVTDQIRLEAEKDEMQRQLFQSSKLASIGELSAGVAHEIGNPINSIINFAQLLKDDSVATTPTHQRMIEGIIDEGARISKIVRDLLAFARRDSQDLTRVNIAETINTSVSLFCRQLDKDGVSLELDLAGNLPPVMAIGSLLRQVVVNMVTNALHALKAKSSDERRFRITARTTENLGQRLIVMEFFDNGVGIQSENLDKVFDPFFTTRRDSGGTGLGLSLSFGILRSFGGTITVESQQGEYTRFRIELPAYGTWDSYDSEEISGESQAHPNPAV